MEARDKKNLLLAVYIFSFIFMLFGVAFSYFTAKANSERKVLDVKSGHLTLALDVSKIYSEGKLIPTNDEDIIKAYHNECTDDYGYAACDAYEITVTNDSAKQDIVGDIDFTLNHIENLSYMVLDENDNIYLTATKVEKSTDGMSLGDNFILDSALETGIPTSKKFTLIIWLTNLDEDQQEDVGGSYSASVTYNSIYGQKLSSSVSGEGRS